MAKSLASDGANADFYGGSVSTSGGFLLIGAEDHTHQPGARVGAAYASRLIPGPVVYCTAKVNSCGSLPAIGWTGTPSASATSGFSITGSNARPNKAGLVLYSNNGRANSVFQGGTLCVASPVRRSVGVPSPLIGMLTDCDSMFTLDMNCFASGNCGGSPQAFLQVFGTQVTAQWWGRDSIANGAYLSDGLEYCVGL